MSAGFRGSRRGGYPGREVTRPPRLGAVGIAFVATLLQPAARPARGQGPVAAELAAEAAPSVDAAAPHAARSDASKPDTFRHFAPRQQRCERRGRLFCDGPRRVPEPHDPAAAARADRLGLGSRAASRELMRSGPTEAMVAEAPALEIDPLLWPVPEGTRGRGVGFNRRASLRHVRHDGVDILAPTGSLVRAAQAGVVAHADFTLGGYGNSVALVHADGLVTFYAHLSAALVHVGQIVARGEKVGAVGTTGLARGPHLHFELRRGAHPLDPRDRFEAYPARGRRLGAP